MLDLLVINPWAFIVSLGGIVLAIGIHEAAHCYMADYLGDPTPRSMGRLTLNPLAHLDPLGTLMIIVTGAFGWGKPAPFDPYNLKDPKRDTALIALAGPASNVIIAIILSIILRFLNAPTSVSYVLMGMIVLNINLALFNLLPIPPLDGSKIFNLRLPIIHNSHFLILLFIIPIFGGHSLASLIISPISNFILNFLI